MATGQTSLWDELLNDLEAALGVKTDPESIVQQLSPYWTQLLGLAEDLSNTMPSGTDLWIVPDGDSDGVNTMTLSEFCTAVANNVAAATGQQVQAARGRRRARAAGGPGPIFPDPVKFAQTLLGILQSLQRFLDPELFLRYWLNAGTMTAQGAALSVATALVDIATFDQSVQAMGWAPGQPDSDADKESWEKIAGVLPVADSQAISKYLALLPFSARTSDWDIGNRLHRWVMAKYVQAHRDHLVIIDGSARWPIGPVGTAMGTLEDAFNQTAGDLSSDMADRIAHFNAQMLDGTKRIRPDIADLAPTATGIDPAQDHGWFEIKPYNSMLTAFEELALLYTALWNAPASVPTTSVPWQDDWYAAPGTWFPPLFYVDTQSESLCVVLNVPPGVISYAVFNIDVKGDLVVLTVIAGAMSAFIQRMLKDLKRQMEKLGEALSEIAFALLVIALLAALIVLVVLASVILIEIEAVGALVAVVVAVIGAALKKLSDPSGSSGA